MNYSMISYILGWIFNFEAAFMLLPGITAIIYREKDGLAFLVTMIICLAIGIPLIRTKRKNKVCLSESGRTIKKHMIQSLSPGFGSFNIDSQSLFGLFLTDIFSQMLRAELSFYFDIFFQIFCCNDSLSHSLTSVIKVKILMLLSGYPPQKNIPEKTF